MDPYALMVVGVALALAPIIATAIRPLEEGEYRAEDAVIAFLMLGAFLIGIGVGMIT